MSGTTLTDLIQLLDTSDSILRYNSEIEASIIQNGGTVLYSYNNIIMASEISDEFYSELLSNPNIDYIQDLPLKRYGDVDVNLIDQLDFSNLYINDSTIENSILNGNIIISTGITYDLTGNTLTNDVDGKSGKSRKSSTQVVENNVLTDTSLSGIGVTISNIDLTLSTLLNIDFNYEIFVNGSTPISFEFVKPNNYNGNLILNGNVLSGQINSEGIYNILIRAKNNYGIDSKNLVITVLNPVKITNTDLQVYSKIGTNFFYTIECTGTPPLIYNVQNLPVGITLNNNIISGIFTNTDSYIMNITVSGLTSSDSKNLTVITGNPPIITSSGQVSIEQYSNFYYEITSSPSTGVTYNLIGILPDGLQFNGTTIEGMPIYDGVYNLKIKASNPFGESYKNLNINVYQIIIPTTTTTTLTPTTTTTTLAPTTTTTTLAPTTTTTTLAPTTTTTSTPTPTTTTTTLAPTTTTTTTLLVTTTLLPTTTLIPTTTTTTTLLVTTTLLPTTTLIPTTTTTTTTTLLVTTTLLPTTTLIPTTTTTTTLATYLLIINNGSIE